MNVRGLSFHFSLCSLKISISSTRDAQTSKFFERFIKCSKLILKYFCRLPNGHINFEKFWQLAKQVTEFMAWKQVTCPFEKNEKVIHYLQTTSILNEWTLALASFECEQPENNHEKDHYKYLKNEIHK